MEHTIPEQQRSNLHHGGSLKSHKQIAVTLMICTAQQPALDMWGKK
jgi:hypothetical protein